ncbi:MAG: ribosome maturation factor RimP [Elusimicrobia bacterium]|nr:ribosome maturation factor RimP [Elusimicrobiota bacterium]
MDLTAIENVLEALLQQEGYELVDVRGGQGGRRQILQIFVDKEGGVRLGDCEYLSHRVGAALDSSELLPGPYELEVSSPGLNRILKKEKDFLRYAGQRVKLQLKFKSSENGQHNFRGVIEAFENGVLRLNCAGEQYAWPLEQIKEVRLDPEIQV